MRILAGGPTRDVESDIYKAHLECLERQVFEGCTLEIRHFELPDKGGPRWTREKMSRVGEVRQEFMDLAVAEEFDALFMVDDDLILGPNVLSELVRFSASVAYAVFLSDWPGLPRAPQVWDTNPYGRTSQLDASLTRDMGVLASDFGFEMLTGTPRGVPVFGGGACTLIRGDGFRSRYSPTLQSLFNRGPGDMWAGEDRTFCLGLETRGITQLAVVGLPVVHLDKPSKQTREAVWEAKQMVGWSN